MTPAERLAEIMDQARKTVGVTNSPGVAVATHKGKRYRAGVAGQGGGWTLRIEEQRPTGWKRTTRYEYMPDGRWYGQRYTQTARGFGKHEDLILSETEAARLVTLLERLVWSKER